MDISLGEPEEAISREIGDDIIVRINSKNEVVGLTVLNFGKRFEKSKMKKDLPLSAKFSLIKG